MRWWRETGSEFGLEARREVRASLGWQAEACPTNAAQPPGSGDRPGGLSYLLMSTRASEAVPSNTAAASSAVNVSTLEEMFMEQNFGTHMEQKCASLKPSSGRVSSCMARAVSGSRESANCSFQSKR